MSEKPMGIIELLQRIGEDHVRLQNLVADATNFRVKGKGRNACTAITFTTDPALITPTDVMQDTMRHVGLVLWLPTALVEQAQRAHAEQLAMREPAS